MPEKWDIYAHIEGAQVVVTEYVISRDEADGPDSDESDGYWEVLKWKRGQRESKSLRDPNFVASLDSYANRKSGARISGTECEFAT
jgi:hypothetical protein